MVANYNHPRVRVEVEAGELTNRVQNHSGQDGNANGWAVLPSGPAPVAGTDPVFGIHDGWAIAWEAAAGRHLAGPPVACAGTSVAFQITIRDIRAAVPGGLGEPLLVQTWVEFLDAESAIVTGSPRVDPVTISDDQPHVITSASTLDAIELQFAPQGAVSARACIAVTRPDGTDPGPGYNVAVGHLMVVQAVGFYSSTSVSCPIEDVAWSDDEAWQNIGGSAVTISIDRGPRRDGILDRVEPGRANVTISDAALDPERSPRLRRGRRFRIRAQDDDATFRPLFTGLIADVKATYPRDKTRGALRPIVTITGDDRVGELGNTAQPANYSGTWPEKVRALMAPSTLPFRAPAGTPSGTAVSYDADANLADQLQRAANTFPEARWWMAADGVVEFAEIDNPSPVAILADRDLPPMRNYVLNASYEGIARVGAAEGATIARTTSWAASGTRSLRVTATATSNVARVYRPHTEDQDPGVVLSQWIDPDTGEALDASGWWQARVTVHAAQDCVVYLVTEINEDPARTTWAATQMTAGDTITLADNGTRIDLGEWLRYTVTVQPFNHFDDPDPHPYDPNDLTGDLVEVDDWCIYSSGQEAGVGTDVQWIPGNTETDPETGVVTEHPARWTSFLPWYWDGDTGGTWEGTPYESASRWAPDASYTDITPAFGLDGMINTLSVVRHLAAEPEGKREYGPYVATESAAEWGQSVDALDVVDPDPWVLGQDVLRRNSIPSTWPDTITVNADKLGDAQYALVFAEPYDSVIVMLTESSIARPAFLLSITHTITTDTWLITYTTRPVDIDPSDTVIPIGAPPAGPATGPVDTVPVSERYDTGWVDVTILPGYEARSAAYIPQVRRIGEMCYFRGHMANTGLSTGSPDILEFPDWAKPVQEQRWMGFRTTEAADPFGGWLSASNGRLYIQIPGAPPAGHWCILMPPYATKD